MPDTVQDKASSFSPTRNQKIGYGVIAAIIALVVIGNLGDGDDKSDKTSTASSTTRTTTTRAAVAAVPPPAPSVTPTPTGPVLPKGVVFHVEPGSGGDVVVADFDIPDAVFMYLTKFGARSTTKDILEYASTVYPQASRVVVQGRFPTEDAYGNSENSVVLNVYYTRETLDKINFAGIDNDKVWTVRDGGTVHPDLQ